MYKIEKNKNRLLDDYEGVAFVIAAIGKEEDRKNLYNRVLFDGACFWGCDGHRVHYYYVHNNAFDPGVYQVVSKDKNTVILKKAAVRKKAIETFPDISKLEIFSKTPKWSIEIKTDYSTGDREMTKSVEYAKIVKRLFRGITINYKFFSDLPLGSYTVYSYGPESLVGFCNQNKGAAIMPLRIT